jgi:phenylpropionate dioxygenase-like ring-hydroxylating dioxygenase large terminal subunit
MRADAGALLERGLRNLWYPIAPSWQVGDNPLGVTRLGERIVVWRDRSGTVHALEDRCPHRGARLSLGWNLGDRLACWYHGVEIDASGTVLDVPAVESCPLTGRAAVRRYPCREVRGAIFAWFGDALHEEPSELGLPEQLVDDRVASILCVATWQCNYRYAIDNVMDPMHGAYLHARSHSMAQGDRRARLRVVPTDTGFLCEKEDQRNVNFDWVEFGATGGHWMRLEIPYGKEAGPGGPFGIVGFVTPVDHETCQVYFWRVRRVEGWQRDLWRFLYRTRLESLHWDVLEQDRLVLEAMAGDAREHEFLYQHDTGLARVRRFMAKEAERQADALAGAHGRADATEGSDRNPGHETRMAGGTGFPDRGARVIPSRNGEMHCNPWLAEPRGNKGDAETVENPGDPLLLRWQTRARPPSEHEDRLADALTAIFGDEVYELSGIAARLNDAGVPAPGGGPWTGDAFTSAMRTLASP